jgi:hypothetical protein
MVKEPTVQEMMLTALHAARAGLRRGSRDECEHFLDYCRDFPRQLWPREVARFVDTLTRPVKELTVQDMMLEALRTARTGLRRKSIDEYEDLLDYCRNFPRELWPPEVARFIDTFKRRPGRMRSTRKVSEKFYGDPDRMAAEIAATFVAEWRHPSGRKPRRLGPYKVRCADGEMRTIHAEAVRQAVTVVNHSHFYKVFRREFSGGRKANPERVKELLRKGRRKPSAVKRLELFGDDF